MDNLSQRQSHGLNASMKNAMQRTLSSLEKCTTIIGKLTRLHIELNVFGIAQHVSRNWLEKMQSKINDNNILKLSYIWGIKLILLLMGNILQAFFDISILLTFNRFSS